MIEGRFVKNGEVVDVVYVKEKPAEIHVIPFLPRKEVRKRNNVKEFAIIMSMAIPLIPLFLLWLNLIGVWAFLISFAASWLWDGIVAYANR